MHRTQAIMSEIEDLKKIIHDFFPEAPIENTTEEFNPELEGDIDWEDVFAKYVDSIRTLATQDVIKN